MIYTTQQGEVPIISYGHLNIIKDFRSLLTELAYLTRFYIASVASGFGDSEAVAARLYSLPNKFKSKAELIFGAPLSEDLITILSNYIITFQTLINATKIGDRDNANESTQRLYSIADQLAAYFSSINPFWEEAQWRNLLYTYNSTLIEQIITLMSGDYVKSLDVFDRLMATALLIGDYLADGFIYYLTVSRGTAR